MTRSGLNPYSAGEQALGYIYQARFALLKLMELPESTSVLIEKDDDLDFEDVNGIKVLASLKHKALNDKLSDLATDFWKSVRIWLERYKRDERIASSLRFFLFTTGEVSETSLLQHFLPKSEPISSLSALVDGTLLKSKSTLISSIRDDFNALNQAEKEDFLSRITIVHNGPRITNLPELMTNQYMRSIRREFRHYVFERLEGWWNDVAIRLLSGSRTEPVCGYEVSDRLSAFSEEYKSDNLPITFRGKSPDGKVDVESDPRTFVVQLRAIGISPTRIQSAILDYYRAFEQRSSWARENLLVAGEMEEYEERLTDEWGRYRDVVFDALSEEASETLLLEAGKALYKWAEFETDHIRLRERVSEPYVVRGAFHILANARPLPLVYWHPRFLKQLEKLLEAAS